jgi:Na+/H+ antiporter NhaC
MSTREAALIAIIAGFIVAGIVWYSLGLMGSLQHALAHRAKKKPQEEEPTPETEG